MSRYGRMDFVMEMGVTEGLEFYNYAIKRKEEEIKISLAPFLNEDAFAEDENNEDVYFKDDRSADEILKGVEDILNGNI